MSEHATKPRGAALVLIMRHGRMQPATTAEALGEEARLHRSADGDGTERDLTSIGRSLAEAFAEQAPGCVGIEHLDVRHEPSDAARLTAVALCDAYRTAAQTEGWKVPEITCTESGLRPSPTYADQDTFDDWVGCWKEAYGFAGEERSSNRALLYIGHEPRVSRLVDRLSAPPRALRPLDRFRPPVTGLNQAEVLAGWFEQKRYRPLWSLGPADGGTEAALRAKVNSKMETAKVFAGVLTAVTTFAGNDIRSLERDGDRASALIGLGFLGLAILLFLVTMFFYDALLMPKRFWGSAPAGRRRSIGRFISERLWGRVPAGHPGSPWLIRPPSSSTLVLFQSMVVVWSRVFVPATFAAGIGLLLFVYGAAELPDDRARWSFTGITVALAVVSIAVGFRGRPRLGSQD